MPVEKTCEQCSTVFKVKPSFAHQRFCGFICKTAHEAVHGRPASQKAATDFNCKVCNAVFSYKPAYLNEYRKKYNKDPMYCTTKCAGAARRLAADQWSVACKQCGKLMPIQRKPGGTLNRAKLLCSTECRSLFRRLSYQANTLENLELFSSRHGPGQRVVDKVQFAIEILIQYPEFARSAGYELRPVQHLTDGPPPA